MPLHITVHVTDSLHLSVNLPAVTAHAEVSWHVHLELACCTSMTTAPAYAHGAWPKDGARRLSAFIESCRGRLHAACMQACEAASVLATPHAPG